MNTVPERGDCSSLPPCEAYGGDDPFIFVSYAHADSAAVYPEIARLRQLGFRIWYDEGIAPTSHWPDALAQALSRCSFFLVFLSPAASASQHVLNEIHFALNRGKPILAIHLADAVLPDGLELQLGRIQAIKKYGMAEDHYSRQLDRCLPPHLLAAEASRNNRPAGAGGARDGTSSITTGTSGAVTSGLPVQLPQFHYGSVVPPEYFIDREDELEEGARAVRAGQGFLLVGNRRAGKTSFCKKLIHLLMGTADNDVLAAHLNLQQCVHLTMETFLEHTILNIIGEMARQVFRCKYTEVVQPEVARSKQALVRDPEFTAFVGLVQRVVGRTHRRGGAAPSPLRATEFIQFSHDLHHILQAKNWRRCVVFYDEANRLPRDLSEELLVCNAETLDSAGVVSIYAASPEMAETFRPLRDSFGRHLTLGPFRSPDDLRRLLVRYYFESASAESDLPATVEAIERLWKLTRGSPYVIQLLAGRSFRFARDQRASQLTEGHVDQAHRCLGEEMPDLFPESPAG
jgi:hypothetical protein